MIRLERAVAQVDAVNGVTRQLSEIALAQLMRRGEYAALADGYPARTVPDVVVARHPAAMTSVESATDDRVFGRLEPDPVGLSIVHIFCHLAEMAGIARAMDRSLDYVAHAHSAASGRVDSLAGDCLACDRPVTGIGNDRIRSGFCSACYMAWWREGKGDRAAFARNRPRWQL